LAGDPSKPAARAPIRACGPAKAQPDRPTGDYAAGAPVPLDQALHFRRSGVSWFGSLGADEWDGWAGDDILLARGGRRNALIAGPGRDILVFDGIADGTEIVGSIETV